MIDWGVVGKVLEVLEKTKNPPARVYRRERFTYNARTSKRIYGREITIIKNYHRPIYSEAGGQEGRNGEKGQ